MSICASRLVPDQGVGRPRLERLSHGAWTCDCGICSHRPTIEIEKDLGQDTRRRGHDPNAAYTSRAPRGFEKCERAMPCGRREEDGISGQEEERLFVAPQILDLAKRAIFV